jgi:hypothetical protein
MQIEKLTPEQHKQAVKLGVKLRKDGKWGFKRKCANEACENVIDEHCYCADTFESAVRTVKVRSAYPCSDDCFIATGDAGWFLEDLTAADVVESGGPANWIEPDQDRLVDKLRAGKPLSPRQREAWQAALDQADFDYDGDDYECGCEV